MASTADDEVLHRRATVRIGAGAGFFVARHHVATCEHVLGRPGTVPVGMKVSVLCYEDCARSSVGEADHLLAPRDGIVVDVDADSDVALIELVQSGDASLPTWPVLKLADASHAHRHWAGYGFPQGVGTCLVTEGLIRQTRTADRRNRPALQLYSDEAAAGNGLALGGYSGAAVISLGMVVGQFRTSPKDEDGRTEGGTIFATPSSAIRRLLERNRIAPPRARCLAAETFALNLLASPELSLTSATYFEERRFLHDGQLYTESDIFRAVTAQPGHVWAVTGGTGIGKSAFARHLVSLACRTLTPDYHSQPVLPIFVSLRTLPKLEDAAALSLDTLLATLAGSFAATGAVFSRAPLAPMEWANALDARLLVVLDGIDERTGASRHLANTLCASLLANPELRASHCLVAFARSSEPISSASRCAVRTVTALPIRQIARYFEARGNAAIATDVTRAVSSLPEECRGRPLFLNIAAELQASGAQHRSSVELFRSYFRKIACTLASEATLREIADGDLIPAEADFSFEFLEEFAYASWWTGATDLRTLTVRSCSELSRRWSPQRLPIGISSFVEWLTRRIPQLGAVFDCTAGQVQWKHVSYQEYLTASRMNRTGYSCMTLLNDKPTVARDVASFLLAMTDQAAQRSLVDAACGATVDSKSLRLIVARSVAFGLCVPNASRIADLLMEDLAERFNSDDACNVLWTLYGGGLTSELERLCDLGGAHATRLIVERMRQQTESGIVLRSYANALGRLRAFAALSDLVLEDRLTTETRLRCLGVLATAGAWREILRTARRALAAESRSKAQLLILPLLASMLRRRFGDAATERFLRRLTSAQASVPLQCHMLSVTELHKRLCQASRPSDVLWACIRLAEAGRLAECSDARAEYRWLVERVRAAYEAVPPREARDTSYRGDATQTRLLFIQLSKAGDRQQLHDAAQSSKIALEDACIALDGLAMLGARQSLQAVADRAPILAVRREAAERLTREWDLWMSRITTLVNHV